MRSRRWATTAFFLGAAAIALALVQAADPEASREDRLARHRNLGKAFYENPTTQAEAVEEFRKALELAPASPRERLNYGLALLRAGKTPEGMAELEKVQKQDPSIPHTWFNLGIQFKKLGENEKAIEQFLGMAKLAPDEPITHYNLGTLYKLVNKPADATREFETAARLDPNLAAPHFQLFNLYRSAKRLEEAQRELATFQRLKKQHEGAAIPEDIEWSFFAEILDIMEDRAPAGPPPELRFRASKREPPKWSGAEGDFNNDGLKDLALLTATGAELYTNSGKNRMVKSAAKLPDGRYAKALWLDFDHDYDLDLFLLGANSVLLRNEGSSGFAPFAFPFVEGEALDAAAFRLVADTKGIDLLVSYKGREGVLYMDRLGGRYEATPVKLAAGARELAPVDLNNDGWIDVAYASGDALAMLLNRNGSFVQERLTGKASGKLFAADLDNDGLQDLVSGGLVLRNRGAAKFVEAEGIIPGCQAVDVADRNGDGRVDIGCDAQLFVNATESKNNWVGVTLAGIKNPKLAPGSEIEVKAGSRYQKLIYDGEPLIFGLGTEKQADTVRITWPNGLIQNEMKQASGQMHKYEEAQRLSGSCPIIWTWNGREFEYITDVLGVAPLGAAAGDGTYFPVDHDEYIQIPAESLRAADGKYEVRITEELAEVSYLDQVQLIALDHPASQTVYTNDKWKSPPFPEYRLFGVRERVAPVSARDSKGREVRERLLRKDGAYPEDFSRNLNGVAERHALDLDFGTAAAREGRAILVLSGWVDWADGSTFLSVAQENRGGLVPPYLQVKNARGEWQTVIEDMGMPAGKPKTIVVDLSGKWLSASREVRILTNLCVYWDEVFLSTGDTTPHVRETVVPALASTLRFRGFSPAFIHPQRKQPERFMYANAKPYSMWNPTPGNYTRFGDVSELSSTVDDKFVVMGSGDELRMVSDARALPPLPAGWRRDFVLRVDGWAKDRDPNTAYSQTVEPLPFHGMSGFPYGPGERYPDTPEHRRYLATYNTRPALRLLTPLTRSASASRVERR